MSLRLTQAQQTTLKTDINSAANAAALGTFITNADWVSVAAFYNGASGSTVWRPSIPVSDLTRNIVGSAFDGLSAAKQNGYLAVTQGGFVDATSANIRSWFSDIFGVGATLTNLTAEAQATATRFQLLFSSVASPSNITTFFGAQVGADDVQQAMLHG